MSKIDQAYQTILLSYQSSLVEQVPPSPFQDFQLWALGIQNPDCELWTQMIGIPQLANLTVALLGELVSSSEWATLMEYSAPMFSYLTFEVISDNLAIGLEDITKGKRTQNLQRQALYKFNNAMIACLENDSTSPVTEIADAMPMLSRLSSFEHSLTCDEQLYMAESFLSFRPDLDIYDIEFGVWPALVANIETCVSVKTALKSFHMGGLLHKSLMWRYQAVNRLFDAVEMPLAQLADVSARAILVIPVLTYYASILTEIIRPNDALHRVTEKGRLAKTIYDAALLVRLTNDLGTQLAMNASQHAFLLNLLTERAARLQGRHATLSEVLLELSEEHAFLTRFRKDILFGEFNVVLNDVRHEPCTPETIAAFGERLAFFNRLYQKHQAHMMTEATAIADILQDDRVSRLIVSFVRFHEHLYDNRFDTQAGDYATKPDSRPVFHPEGQD